MMMMMMQVAVQDRKHSTTDSSSPALTAPRSGETAASPSASRRVIEVSPVEVEQWIRAGSAVLIDVREPDEYAREHISGSTLLPLSRFDPQAAAGLVHQPGQRLVLHCRSGRRSADAAGRMVASGSPGSSTIFNMTGGIEAWKQAQLPVEVNTKVSRLSLMRQVQLAIGSGVLIGSVLTYFVHPLFIIIPAFFGAGLIFAGLSGLCGLAILMSKMPWNRAVSECSTCADGPGAR